jgi:hypothetical protein
MPGEIIDGLKVPAALNRRGLRAKSRLPAKALKAVYSGAMSKLSWISR